MGFKFPGEPADYREARNELIKREVELRRLAEKVAAERRKLPPGGPVPQDYVFQIADARGEPVDIKMSELFAPGQDTIAIYNFMYGPKRQKPCPMCTSMLDTWEGAAPHIHRRAGLYVVAKSSLPRVLAFTRPRGWKTLRMLSSFGNSYNRDYAFEKNETEDNSILNIFRREKGVIRHFWACELAGVPPDPGQDPRHLDMVNPIWTFFDLLPEGRPEKGITTLER